MSWPTLGQMTGSRTGGHHLDFYPTEVEDAFKAADTVYQLAMQQIPKEVEASQALLIYPEGEGDAVTITERDMEELLPERFLGNHIVDFYIRYLERGLSPERRSRFYFFNSFFFTKLLQSTAASLNEPCKVDYEQLRSWTKEVNLFEKDYVFIPIVERSHWSLVILCNLSSLTRAHDEMTRFPCIVHLDPVKGQHESFEGLIRRYVLEAWMDRFQPPLDKDQLRALSQMKYIQAEVPQQDNSHDCGLYILHYIESFLVECTSPNFSFASRERGPHFTNPHFATEVLAKRRHIQNLIQERAQKCKEIKHLVQELMQTSQKLRACLEDEGNSKACIKDVLIASPTIFNVGIETNHASIHEDSMDAQLHQSSGISRGNNEPLSGPQIGPIQYETRCEHLPLQQQYVEYKVQTVGPIICNGPIFETKHASTYEDAIDVEYQQSSVIPWSEIESLDGLELPHVDFQSFSGKYLFPELEEVPCMDLCKARKGKNKRGEYLFPELEEVPCMDLCKAWKGKSKRGEYLFPELEEVPCMDLSKARKGKNKRGKYLYPELEEVPCMDLSKARKGKNKRGEYLFPELEEVPCMDLSKARKGKNKRGKNMTEEETCVLLSCKLEGGRFWKGSRGTTHWNLISEEIEKKLGSLVSADQCRLRYDTLMKAYKKYKNYCVKTGKMFSAITEAERHDLKLATTLSEEWYIAMNKIFDKANKSQKRMKLSSNVCSDLHPFSSPDSFAPNPPPISQGRSFEVAAVVLDNACETIEVALRNVIPASVFSFWNEDLQSTLLNLVQECSLPDWIRTVKNGKFFGLEAVCRRLAILQDREPREILDYVYKLWKLDFVNVVDMVFEEGKDLPCIDLWKGKTWFFDFELYEKISKEVLCKNPHLKTYCNSFPIEQSSLLYIRVLRLIGCGELEHLDLGEFPSLRSLTISHSPKFKLVTGWEVAKGLRSLEIIWCNAYCDFPEVQYLFSLRELEIHGRKSKKSVIPWQLSQLSQCINLQRLAICYDKIWLEIVDLENLKGLKFLEFLSLRGCTFSRIKGLSGLQALTTLDLHLCSLRGVPELGYLKGLTHLNMSNSSVEDVVGVGELHLLTWLDLSGCKSLKWLPFLGHLKALVHLDLRETCIVEIPGKEDLISLKTLC